MTDETINTMIKVINRVIGEAKEEYKNGRTDFYTSLTLKVYGMIEMLTIATGKYYYFDDNGLHERV